MMHLCKMQKNAENLNWHAFYTKPRTEKKLAERLEAKGYEVFAPTQTVLKQWSDRKKKVEEPLFRSYVFVRVDTLNHLDILQTPGAVAIVRWLSKPAIIRDEEIQAIKDFLSLSNGLEVEIRDFKRGDKLRVKYGNLENATGSVIRQTKQKVILEIEKLGIALYAEVPKSQVEKLN